MNDLSDAWDLAVLVCISLLVGLVVGSAVGALMAAAWMGLL